MKILFTILFFLAIQNNKSTEFLEIAKEERKNILLSSALCSIFSLLAISKKQMNRIQKILCFSSPFLVGQALSSYFFVSKVSNDNFEKLVSSNDFKDLIQGDYNQEKFEQVTNNSKIWKLKHRFRKYMKNNPDLKTCLKLSLYLKDCFVFNIKEVIEKFEKEKNIAREITEGPYEKKINYYLLVSGLIERYIFQLESLNKKPTEKIIKFLENICKDLLILLSKQTAYSEKSTKEEYIKNLKSELLNSYRILSKLEETSKCKEIISEIAEEKFLEYICAIYENLINIFRILQNEGENIQKFHFSIEDCHHQALLICKKLKNKKYLSATEKQKILLKEKGLILSDAANTNKKRNLICLLNSVENYRITE